MKHQTLEDLIRELPKPKMEAVLRYFCSRCDCFHFEDTDGDCYFPHIPWHSRDGVKLLHETMDERRKRYGLSAINSPE
jgi:hypothetical protein